MTVTATVDRPEHDAPSGGQGAVGRAQVCRQALREHHCAERHFASPKEALGADAGVAKPLSGSGDPPKSFPWTLDSNAMRTTTLTELSKMGIDLPDVDVAIGSLSGGQRQCVTIAHAVFLGACVLILDEPFGVVFITHKRHHDAHGGSPFRAAEPGRQKLDCTYDEITEEHLTQAMAGNDELEALSHELRGEPAEWGGDKSQFGGNSPVRHRCAACPLCRFCAGAAQWSHAQ
jgi:ABC transporter